MAARKNNHDKQENTQDQLVAEARVLFFITVFQITGISILSFNLILKLIFNYNFLLSKWDYFIFQIHDYFLYIPVYEFILALFIFFGFGKYWLKPYKMLRNKQYKEKTKKPYMPAMIDICGFAIIVFSFVNWVD